MANIKILLATLFMLSYAAATSASIVDFIKRGLKHCTGTCDQDAVCSMDQDATYRWCLANCAKNDVKGRCEPILPSILRPILPYENYAGLLTTNQVTVAALKTLDRTFIEQTVDRRRVVGTAKVLLLVREQLLTGKNVQLPSAEREKLAEKLLENFFKGVPTILEKYKSSGLVDDDKLSLLFKEVKSEIFAKLAQKVL